MLIAEAKAEIRGEYEGWIMTAESPPPEWPDKHAHDFYFGYLTKKRLDLLDFRSREDRVAGRQTMGA